MSPSLALVDPSAFRTPRCPECGASLQRRDPDEGCADCSEDLRVRELLAECAPTVREPLGRYLLTLDGVRALRLLVVARIAADRAGCTVGRLLCLYFAAARRRDLSECASLLRDAEHEVLMRGCEAPELSEEDLEQLAREMGEDSAAGALGGEQ